MIVLNKIYRTTFYDQPKNRYWQLYFEIIYIIGCIKKPDVLISKSYNKTFEKQGW